MGHGMRVLVTGAQGCIGAWVMKALIERDIDVVAFDLSADFRRLSMIAPAWAAAKVKAETGRIEDCDRVKALVRDHGITHIVHLAATLIPFCQQQPAAGALVNVIGTLNVFEAAREAGRPVRVVYASSAAVWGPPEAYEARPLGEHEPPMPSTHYGVFKHATEQNARVFYECDGVSSIGLRPWTVYGVGRDTGLTAGPTLAMKSVVMQRSFEIGIIGPIDLQYAGDVAEAFVACLLARLEGAHVFNLAGDVVTIEDFISRLDRLRPGAARLITAAGSQVPIACRLDDSRLRSLVPGIPKTSLEDGMGRTLDIFERLKAEGKLD